MLPIRIRDRSCMDHLDKFEGESKLNDRRGEILHGNLQLDSISVNSREIETSEIEREHQVSETRINGNDNIDKVRFLGSVEKKWNKLKIAVEKYVQRLKKFASTFVQ